MYANQRIQPINNKNILSIIGRVSKGTHKSHARKPASAKQKLLIAAGGYFLGNEAAKLLGITEQKLEELRQTDKAVGLPVKDGRYVYPKWQFTENSLLPGLDRVLAEFPYKNPWSRAAFMLDTCLSTGIETPLAGLKSGKLLQVLVLARDFGKQGAL